MTDVYVSHPAALTVIYVQIHISAHARVCFFNRRKIAVCEMFYNYLRYYMSSGVYHPAVAKHENAKKRIRSAALKHTLKGVFKKAKFEANSSPSVTLTLLSSSPPVALAHLYKIDRKQ